MLAQAEIGVLPIVSYICIFYQRWPESHFQTPTPAPIQNFLNPGPDPGPAKFLTYFSLSKRMNNVWRLLF